MDWVLTALRDRLASVAGIVTCRVGIEANMTPADYPMVRIVPGKVSYAAVLGRRKVDCLVYSVRRCTSSAPAWKRCMPTCWRWKRC